MNIKYSELEYQISLIKPNYEYSAISYQEAKTELKQLSTAGKSYYKQKTREINKLVRSTERYIERVERFS